MIPHQQVTVLFDEFGNPTFRNDRHSEVFLGVSVAYHDEDENHIFQQCDLKFGLSNLRPLKNDRIRTSRAEDISELICSLPIHVTISSIELSNTDLQRVVKTYEGFGNEGRRLYRDVRERPVAQILHSDLLYYTLVQSFFKYLETNPVSTDFDVYIDDWAIPASDIESVLQGNSRLLGQKVTEVFGKLGVQILADVSPIQLMQVDSKRKRFIDVVTSAVSRSFLSQDNPKYSSALLKTILANPNNQHIKITSPIIEFLRYFMNKYGRNLAP